MIVLLPKRDHKKYLNTDLRTMNFDFILARLRAFVEVAKTVLKTEFAELKGGSQSFKNDTGTSPFTTSLYRLTIN